MPATNYPAHWTETRIAEFHAAQARVTRRQIGVIPLGMIAGTQIQGPPRPPQQPTVKPFDARAYDARVDAYCKEIRDTIAHMDAVRAGMVEENAALVALEKALDEPEPHDPQWPYSAESYQRDVQSVVDGMIAD